jgi:hypothetical protein
MQRKAPPRQPERTHNEHSQGWGLGSGVDSCGRSPGSSHSPFSGRSTRPQPPRWTNAAIPRGQMVDVGRHSLHIAASEKAAPVILEAANLGMSAHWIWVQQQLANHVRVRLRLFQPGLKRKRPEAPRRQTELHRTAHSAHQRRH